MFNIVKVNEYSFLIISFIKLSFVFAQSPVQKRIDRPCNCSQTFLQVKSLTLFQTSRTDRKTLFPSTGTLNSFFSCRYNTYNRDMMLPIWGWLEIDLG